MKHLLLLLGGSWDRRERLCRNALYPADHYSVLKCLTPHEKYAEGVLLWDYSPAEVGQPAILGFLRAAEPARVVAFSPYMDNEVFLRETRALGYEVCVARLVLPESLYSKEESVWWSNPIPRSETPRGWWLDAVLPDSVLIARLRLHPAVRAIWQGSRKHYVQEREADRKAAAH
jgi:hypothetical protein